MTPSLTCHRSIAALIACTFAALATTSATAQTTATTDPVGFITLNVAGTAGTGGTSQLSFEGLSLTTPVLYQGSSETATAGTNTVVDNEGTFTNDQFNGAAGEYYLEITSGTAAGTTYNILDTVAPNTVTLTENLAAGVAAGATFKIRKHWTIGTVFGPTNQAGLFAGSASTADLILIYNGSTYDTYYYSSGGAPGVGWRKQAGGAADQVNTKIYQDDGVIIQRRQASPLGVILMGAVKTGKSSIPVYPGLNFAGNVYAANMTLESSGLFTDASGVTGVKPGSASTADLVLIYNGSTYDTYYYSSGGAPGMGWRQQAQGATEKKDVPIGVGVAVIINRRLVPHLTGYQCNTRRHLTNYSLPNTKTQSSMKFAPPIKQTVKTLAAICLASLLTTATYAASIVVAAEDFNGVADQAGTLLPVGNQIRVGVFSLTDSQIKAAADARAYAVLEQGFSQIGVLHVGDSYPGSPGIFSKELVVLPNVSSFANAQVYLWVFKTDNNLDPNGLYTNVLETGVFYMDKTVNDQWRFRPETDVPNRSNIDLSNLTGSSNTLIAGAHVAAGSFSKSADLGFGLGPTKQFSTQTPIPEPTAIVLLGLGLFGLSVRRQRA